MAPLDSPTQNSSASRSQRETLTKYLQEAGLGTERFIRAAPGCKCPDEGESWRGDDEGRPPGGVGRNNLVKAGDGLLIIDVDSPEQAPELPDTFSVSSVHGDKERGHLYYKYTGEEVPNRSLGWGELRGDGGLVVGPGSEVHGIRGGKDCSRGCCTPEDPGEYAIHHERIFAEMRPGDLHQLGIIDEGDSEDEMTSDESSQPIDAPEPDPILADEGEGALRTLQKEAALAFDALIDRLQGGAGGNGNLLRVDGTIDRSAQEQLAATQLYEAVYYLHGVEDERQARAIARATLDRYFGEHRYTEDGQQRKWFRDENYRRQTMEDAVAEANPWDLQRLLNRTWGEGVRWSNEYSDVTTGVVLFALDLLTGHVPTDGLDLALEHARLVYDLGIEREKLAEVLEDHTPPVSDTDPPTVGHVSPDRRPTKAEVVEVAQLLDPSRSEGTHETALRRLQYVGAAKLAFCPSRDNGERYVYYPAALPDPDDARWIKIEGEKREPGGTTASDEPEAMTDGGTELVETGGLTGDDSGQYSEDEPQSCVDEVLVMSGSTSSYEPYWWSD